MQNIIIIGAGQAATQAANSLRQNGFVGNIKIFGNENQAPYQRPPLSKAYLMGEMPIERLEFKALSQWENDNIELRINEPIISINTKAKIATSDKGDYNYDKLIFATGSSVRKLEIANNELKNIHYLKSIQDSNLLAKDFETAKNLVVIGGGYIGLEVAAVARKKGLKVTIIEIAPRVLARVACPQISQFYHDIHSQAGVEIITNTGIKELIGTNKVEKIILSNGREIIADVILIGIGIIPNDELAKAAGIICNNGIDVDENSKTSNEDIYACGDCANRVIELYGKRMRLESVHNALEQAKIAAADIMNKPKPKLETPWFWSDQYELKLQIAGLWNDAAQSIIRGSIKDKKFAIFHLDKNNRILAVDAINSPPEFLMGKNLISQQAHIKPEIIADLSISAKELAQHIQN